MLPPAKIRFSHGAEWKALISKYIETIPVKGDASCAAEQSVPGMPRARIPVSRAMIAKVGAAASDIQSAAPSTGCACLFPFWFIDAQASSIRIKSDVSFRGQAALLAR